MQIGLIGGIGPAATEFYYRTLVRLFELAGKTMSLTIVHADARTMTANMMSDDRQRQAEVFAKHIRSLKGGGCDFVAITSIAGHFCFKELEPLSQLPLVSAIPALDDYIRAKNLRRVGVLGTLVVMSSKLYGLKSADVIAPSQDQMGAVHCNYVAMSKAGLATDEQKDFFKKALRSLYEEHGVDAVVLGGTDLALAFDRLDRSYPTIDSALVHAEAIAARAMA